MTGSAAGRAAIEALRRVTSSFDGAEERQGQIDMSHAIAESLASGRSIIVPSMPSRITSSNPGSLLATIGRPALIPSRTTIPNDASEHDLRLDETADRTVLDREEDLPLVDHGAITVW